MIDTPNDMPSDLNMTAKSLLVGRITNNPIKQIKMHFNVGKTANLAIVKNA